jgi:hypothetical protein
MTCKNEETPVIIKKECFLWWRDEFYQSRLKQWHIKWLNLAANTPAEHEDGPVAALNKLTEINCDPDVALRLAFLEANHKPATQSELAKENARQQRIKRKLNQSRTRLLEAALLLEQAAADAPLIFIQPEKIGSLRTLADMCGHQIETLLWPRALELPPGHELFTLVAYVKSCAGNPNYTLVTDLLGVVYQAHGRRAPTQDAITKQVQRFRKAGLVIPEMVEESTSRRAKSGELKEDLLTCYPDQTLR